MATEIKKVLTIDTTSLKEYKKHITDLRGELLVLEKGSEEYVKIEQEIEAETKKLNEVLKAGKQSVEGASDSYNALNKQLVEARKAFKMLSEEERNSASGKQMLKHIQDLDGQLKNLDKSIGQNFRNVGDYATQFSSAFKSMGGSVQGVVPAVGMLNNAFKMLAMNPIGAVIAAIGIVIVGLVKAISDSEEQTNRLRQAFSIFQPVLDGVKNLFTWLADGVVTAFEAMSSGVTKFLKLMKSGAESIGWNTLAESIDGALNSMDKYSKQTEEDIAIQQRRREVNLRTAELDREISDLRARIADSDKLSTKERIALVNEWEKKELERANLQREIATREAKLMKEKAENTANSTKDNDALNEAEIRLIKTDQEYNEALRSINRQKSALLKSNEREIASQKDVNSEMDDAAKKAEEYAAELQKIREEQEKLNESALKSGLKQLEKDAEKQQYWNTLYLENESERANVEYDIQRQLIEDKIALNQTYLDEYILSETARLEVEQTIYDAQEQLYRLDAENKLRLEREKTQLEEQETQKRIKIKQREDNAYKTSVRNLANVFSALADLSEEGSEEQKAFAIMGTTIASISSMVFAMMSVWQSEMGLWAKIAMSVTLGASTLATGLAQVKKIQGVTKNSGTSGLEGGIGRGGMIGVAPLLNQQNDISNLQSLNITQDQDRQDLRVYVVESDITNAQDSHRTKVDESSF